MQKPSLKSYWSMQMTKPTNKHNHEDEQETKVSLNALYEQRKSQHELPNSMRQNMLNTLSDNERVATPWWKISLKPYVQISAVTCSVAVAFIVISLQVVNKQAVPLKLESAGMQLQSAQLNEYRNVELHELASNEELFGDQEDASREFAARKKSRESEKVARKVQYKRAQEGYLARQADINIHHQTFATIVNNEDGLSLLTCDQNLLKLSQDIVELLMSGRANKQIDFTKGQIVALAFDQNGHIIDIKNQTKKTEC